MVNEELFDEKVMRACARAAKRVIVVNKRYVEYGDVLGECYLWVAKNPKYVDEWLEQGQHGINKLGVALYRAGHAFVARERARRTGASLGDFYYYTPGAIEELLPDMWDRGRWDSSGPTDADMPRGKAKPGEGGNRRAMMIDVSYAVSTLPIDDQRLLRDRFLHYPDMPNEELGWRYNLTGDALRKRIDRILQKLVDRLGGEPPFWRNSRRAQSNASAQSKTSRQE